MWPLFAGIAVALFGVFERTKAETQLRNVQQDAASRAMGAAAGTASSSASAAYATAAQSPLSKEIELTTNRSIADTEFAQADARANELYTLFRNVIETHAAQQDATIRSITKG